jgi:hypothetical protein
MSAYFDLFPRENIRIVLFEDLKREPDALFAGLERFLGVEHVPLPHLHLNASSPVQSRLLKRVLDAKRVAHALLPNRVLRGLTGAVHRVESLNTGPTAPGIPLGLRGEIEERFYGDSIRRLEQLTGLDLRVWRYRPALLHETVDRREHLSKHAHSQNSGAGASL